jgi:TolB-like protein
MPKTILLFCVVLSLLGQTGCTSKYSGYHALQKGDLAEAARKLKAAVKSSPDDVDVHKNLAMAYLGLGDAALAEKHFDQAVKLDPQDRISKRLLAITREQLGWQTRAMQSFDDLIKSYPGDRLTSVFTVHLARLNGAKSSLTKQAGLERFEIFKEKGLLDAAGLPLSIVVLPFNGPVEYPEYLLLSKTLARTIATDLSRMDFIWVIGPDEARAGMKLRGLSWDPADIPGSIREVGKVFGAGLVIHGKLLKGFEDQIRADILLVDPDPYSKLLESKTSGTTNQFFNLEREVLNKLLGSLGILPNERERSRFGQFSSLKPDALGLYLDGIGKLLENHYSAALALLEESIEKDPDFPCPHRALAILYRIQGRQERSQSSANKGRGRGNPKCAADTKLLAFRVNLDSQVASLLATEIVQGRTAMRNGAQTLFVDEGSIQAQSMLLGLSGSGSPSPNALKDGWIWGAESGGIPGRADSSVLGGIKGHGLSAPDPATAGTGK